MNPGGDIIMKATVCLVSRQLVTRSFFLFLFSCSIISAGLVSATSTAQENFSSIMDPHPIPNKGLWFEGWYNRWVDHDTGLSLAIITTSYLSKGEVYTQGGQMSGYIALIIQKPGAQKPVVIERFPDDTSMLSHGEVPRRRVDFKEKTDFRWQSEEFGYLTEDEIHIHIPNVVEFKARFTEDRNPWSETSNNIGPGSISSFIGAIPLHWYVFSTATVSPYALNFPESDETFSGTSYVHQEKNWGEQFPKAWMWVQAINSQNSSFVLAGGQADLVLTTTEAFMGTYRDEDLTVNFNPLNVRRFEKTIDPENGFFKIVIETRRYILEVESSAPTDTFSTLSIPTENGYLPGAVESFVALTTVKAFKKTGFFQIEKELIRETQFFDSALEFGAGYWTEFESLY